MHVFAQQLSVLKAFSCRNMLDQLMDLIAVMHQLTESTVTVKAKLTWNLNSLTSEIEKR
jgi:L-rhamnose isomerase